jgi:hypothetical protein
LNTPISLEKIEEIQDIMTYGILATPGVVVDGNVVHSGGVPSREKIEQWLTIADAERSSLPAGGCCAGATRS